MEIINIIAPDNTELVDEALENNIDDNIIMEQEYFVSIECSGLYPENLIDRLIYEYKYLRRTKTFSKYNDNGRCTIYLSIRECVDFLYRATPPALQDRVQSSIKCVSDIVECMKTFLLENSQHHLYYVSVFIDQACLFNKNRQAPSYTGFQAIKNFFIDRNMATLIYIIGYPGDTNDVVSYMLGSEEQSVLPYPNIYIAICLKNNISWADFTIMSEIMGAEFLDLQSMDGDRTYVLLKTHPEFRKDIGDLELSGMRIRTILKDVYGEEDK